MSAIRSLFTLATIACAGCASQLVVSTNEGTGIPVAQAMTVIEQSKLTENSKDENKVCTPVSTERFVSIASPSVYYVNVNAAEFGGSEFSIDLHEDGTLDTLSLNSTPAPTEAANALATLASDVLPAIVGAGPGRTEAANACDAGKRITCVRTMDGKVLSGTCEN